MATGYQLPVPQDPNQVNPYALYGYGYGPYGGRTTGVDTSQMGFAPSGNEADVNPDASMEDIYAANRDTINTTGNMIGAEAGNELNYYGGLQQQYTGAENKALNDLNTTPGYTADETAAVMGDPNAPVNTLNAGVGKESDALSNYASNLGTQLNQSEGWAGDAAGQYKSGVSGAAAGLGQGLQSAQGKFAPLDTAVNNPALGFDPNSTENQMTDQDVQNLITQAGTTTGNQFRTAEDTLERQAAAQGNTSPAAEAALRQQLVTQEASSSGDTMTDARIAAKQAQFTRAQQIEAQREAALQAQTGLKATAATTEEAAAQAAAAQAGQANIGAQESIGSNTQAVANQQGQNAINAANTIGQFSTGQQDTQTNQQYGADNTAEQEAAARAANVAGQRISGQGAYRSGVAQQEGLAQQGGQAAVQAQLGAYGTQTQGSNAAASGQGNFEVGKPSFGDTLNKGLSGDITSLFGEGGTADHEMIAKVGEKGPEMVIPANGGGNVNAMMMENVRDGRYRSRRAMEDEFGVAA